MAVEQAPRRIDFCPDAYGIDYPTEPSQYFGEVHSKAMGKGPTCFYNKGEKIYTLRSGEVKGEFVKGEYVVYLLDLSNTSLSAEQLKDLQVLKQTIESRKDQIVVKELKAGGTLQIEKRVLHQAFGEGVLKIEVTDGYEEGEMIETDKVNLSDYVSLES